MTAIIGFAGPGYGLLAIDRNVVMRHRDGSESVLSADGGKLHAGPDGYFAGAGKAELLAGVAKTVATTTDPEAVARAMRKERKTRYARKKAQPPERSFGVLLRKAAGGPEVHVLRPDDGYRPELVPPGRPLVTGPEDPAMRPLIGAFRMLFAPTPGSASLATNVDLLHLYFWLRHRLNPLVSADFDVAVVTANVVESATHTNEMAGEPRRAEEVAAWLGELGSAFGELAKLIANGEE